MLKKIKIFLAAIGILGAMGGVVAKENQTLPIIPEDPNTSETDFSNAIEPDCDTYIARWRNEAAALYALPDIGGDRSIKKEDIIDKYGIPNEEKPIIIKDDKPVLKYGIPNGGIIKKQDEDSPPVKKYGIPGIKEETEK